MHHRLEPALGLMFMAILPSMPLADQIDDAAADGASFATEIFPDATVDQDGNISIGGGQESVAPEELFPGANDADTAAFTDIDTEEKATEAGDQARVQGGDAIDVVDDTNAQEHDDFASDSFLHVTDQTFGDIDALADEFGACSTEREIVPTVNTALIPELRFCERIRKVEGGCTITHQLDLGAAGGAILADVWGPPDCMIAASHAVGPSVCTGTAVVTEGAALGECLDIDGVTICPGDSLYEQLSPPPFDGKEQAISRLALAVEIGPLDCETNLPNLPCITTSTGGTLCPADEGEIIDTCGGLRADPVCRFIDQACVLGAEVDGVCYLEEARFECDQDIAYETYQQQTSLSCPVSDIRCNGNDCIEVDQEANNGITLGLAALTASQLLAFDSACSSLDPGSCVVYPGKASACQRGIGGIFDACELPAPAGPGPYLDLAFSIGALDTNLTVLEPTSPLRGAWETLRDPAVAAVDSLKTPFTSANNSVSASTVPNANDDIAAQDLERTKQALLNGAADDVLETFGPGAVNELFLGPSPDGIAATENGRNGDVTLKEPPAGEPALSLVANAYSASAGETVAAEPAPLVDQDDVASAAHDDAKNCLFVETQCTPDSFGACISRDRVLCCFNSPLSRLAQESAVPQFGRDFGSAETPDCRGLASGEIQRFDWTTLDLDQWIAILGTAGRYPAPDKLTPDGLTGAGNFLDLVVPDQPRPDVIARTRQRLDGIDVGQVRRRARDETGRRVQ
ncbi:MAG: conjugal transfer protein TraN [Alphaproteobacteria bacterium]|nr:conjugal transfer protein TraN [Alphaproteobacteria bacterium]